MTTLKTAAQQALETLESGALLCEVTAASMLRVALEAEQAQTSLPATHKTTGWAAPVDRYAVPVLFNPYTGDPRDVRDVQSDPQGVLIVPPGKVEMLAAKPTVESVTDCMMNLVDRLGHEASDVDARAWDHLLVYAPKQAQAVEPVAPSLRPPRTAQEFKFGMEVLNWNRAQQDPPIDIGRELWVADEMLKLPTYTHPAPTPNGTIGNGSHRLVELDLLGAIAGALNRSKNAPNILEKVRGLIKLGGGVGRGPDAPYTGMIEAFEAHYGQSFTDKDWRNETGIWAAAWGCAVRQSPTPAMRLSGLLAEKGITLQKTFVEKPRDHVPDATKIINEPYDQQALELCNECGWKAIMPGEQCFVCNMKTEAQQVAVSLTEDQIIDAFCKTPDCRQHVSAFKAGVKYAEAHYGIGAKP